MDADADADADANAKQYVSTVQYGVYLVFVSVQFQLHLCTTYTMMTRKSEKRTRHFSDKMILYNMIKYEYVLATTTDCH